MDPTMLSTIAAQQVSEYLDELDHERQLRQWYGHRRTPRRRFPLSLRRRKQPTAQKVSSERPATETC